MKYLVDVNVFSEATKPDPKPAVITWLRANEEDLVIDPIVLGEIRLGILLLPKGRRKNALELWFESRISLLECVTWDARTGIQWAMLLAALRGKGQTIPLKDSMIAASALAHGLTVATRNTGDFQATQVPLVNPFED